MTDRRHLRKPVEFKMLLRPILLHVARYSEYISDRDTEPSGFVSKCAFSLLEETTGRKVKKQDDVFSLLNNHNSSQEMNYSYHCSVNFSPSSSTMPGGGWLD